MPNSIEFKLVIQTSTTNSAHCVLTLVLAAFALPALAAGGRTRSIFSARSSTSALASRAASAAAASASSSAVIVLLPSAMMRLLEKSAGDEELDGANQS